MMISVTSFSKICPSCGYNRYGWIPLNRWALLNQIQVSFNITFKNLCIFIAFFCKCYFILRSIENLGIWEVVKLYKFWR